jgi:hypothetical protein
MGGSPWQKNKRHGRDCRRLNRRSKGHLRGDRKAHPPAADLKTQIPRSTS